MNEFKDLLNEDIKKKTIVNNNIWIAFRKYNLVS